MPRPLSRTTTRKRRGKYSTSTLNAGRFGMEQCIDQRHSSNQIDLLLNRGLQLLWVSGCDCFEASEIKATEPLTWNIRNFIPLVVTWDEIGET
jgi:hypothetical protein